MMKYFPVSSEADAQFLSAMIYDLTRPSGAVSDTTQYALPWVTDANGVCYLCVSLEFGLPVHPDRGNAIETALRGLQSAGKVSSASVDSILALASANVGKVVTVEQVIPPEWLAIAVDSIVLPPEEVTL